MPGELTIKQKLFAQEYASNGGNGAAAARAAYDVNTDLSARAVSSDNLHKPHIRKQILVELERLGVSDAYLARTHKRFLALSRRKSIPEKALGFKALSLTYRLRGDIADDHSVTPAAMPMPVLNVLVNVLGELKPALNPPIDATVIANEPESEKL